MKGKTMTAKSARRLRIGDTVQAAFGVVRKNCTIVEIAWPHFTVETTLKSGMVKRVMHRYAGIFPEEPTQ